MLEPTGNIKVAQEKFARAVGADHVFFVTNGTSTSNKMVYQAVTKPGDIVIVDRNCHKGLSHDGILDVWRRAATHDQAGAVGPEGRG
ncbi:hypothetical protein G6F59_017443 [Rhizopus arrhizus]|nr:hypothetical protein G6F59_017443 [Rhizopus arrhizus]